jgi:hypothetical protein
VRHPKIYFGPPPPPPHKRGGAPPPRPPPPPSPGFNESYYGFRSFGKLLEDAQSRSLIALEPDEKSGGVIIRSYNPDY